MFLTVYEELYSGIFAHVCKLMDQLKAENLARCVLVTKFLKSFYLISTNFKGEENGTKRSCYVGVFKNV